MLVTLGARNQPDGLVDALAACHRRIRQHLVFARRIAREGHLTSLHEVATVAAQVRRYFAIALPQHIADEDLSIAPRLRGTDPRVDAALDRMTADHHDHERLVTALVEHCAVLDAAPSALPARAAALGALVEELATELGAHLELEEQVIFPAVRMLPRAVSAEIQAEMRQRRTD